MDGDRPGRGDDADAGSVDSPALRTVETARALATQIKPPFMLPAVAAAGFGALLAPSVAPLPAGLHGCCVALALYVAHLRDERVDAHVRGEEAPSVPARLLPAATVVAVLAFALSAAGLWVAGAGPLGVGLTLPPLALGLLHAPYLDTNPVAGSADYPVAIGFVIVGGYAVQTGSVPGWLVLVALPFVLVLAGATVALDRLDRDFDARIGKRTVPVVLGDARAAGASAALVACGGVSLLAFALLGSLPRTTAVAGIVPLAAAALSVRARPTRAVTVQMVAAYPFAVALFLATCLGVPCAVARSLGW
ncbi:UbiA family prenyltransferase [Halobaculum sp. EA56]|uniref:UbiA family prenyltransferase n=1 Tax=Halobaculum sp. EA56 TaxID=3421648 RepID=UPI003EBCAB89